MIKCENYSILTVQQMFCRRFYMNNAPFIVPLETGPKLINESMLFYKLSVKKYNCGCQNG